MLRVDELRETCRDLMNEVAETDLVNADLQTKIRMLEVSNQLNCLNPTVVLPTFIATKRLRPFY
jgi:hypothetical protein